LANEGTNAEACRKGGWDLGSGRWERKRRDHTRTAMHAIQKSVIREGGRKDFATGFECKVTEWYYELRCTRNKFDE
jgi:hypothetical protein